MDADKTEVLRNNGQNEAAWDQWFRAIYPRVYYILFRKTSGDVGQTEDLVQGTIERFLRYDGIDKVKNDDDAVAYLTKTGLRLWADFSRSDWESMPYSDLSSTDKADEREWERTLDLDRLAEALDPEDRNIVQWLHEGRSVSEVAERMRISYSAAGTRIHRVKEKLKKIIDSL